MAYAYPTLLDIAKINAGSAAVDLIEENLNFAPEVSIFPAITIAGTSYDTLIRTDFPTGGFRNANEGVEPTKSSWSNKKVETYIYEQSMEVDVKVAEATTRGADYALALEASGHAQRAVINIGKQIWGGTTIDAKGFPGAISIVDSSLVVDAAGTTASTGSSVWGVKFGPQFVNLVFGMNQTLAMSPWMKQFITRSSKELLAYKANLSAWIGCQWVNKNAVGRIKNLTEDANKGLTDKLVAKLLALYPVGYAPDALFMTRRSRRQLQESRSAVTTALTGSQPLAYAPLPIESNGIPIIVTDSITNTETIA